METLHSCFMISFTSQEGSVESDARKKKDCVLKVFCSRFMITLSVLSVSGVPVILWVESGHP